jgi:ATP-dependent Lhr-like helicase
VLRIYVSEEEITPQSTPLDELRVDLVQTVAMVRLLLEHWIEAPADPGLNLSTLIQQALSTIAQHGGATPAELHGALCGPGPFHLVNRTLLVRLLRAMAAADLIVQSTDGMLLLGQVGERIVNHYSFYPAFATPEEWSLVADGRHLGALPIDQPLFVDGLLIFAGRRWKITAVDPTAKVVELTRTTGGVLPRFGSDGPTIDIRVREEMVAVYNGTDVPAWLDRQARTLLEEGRAAWRRYSLATRSVLPAGTDCLVFPWAGDKALITATFQLIDEGLRASREGCVLRVADCSAERFIETSARLAAEEPADPFELARRLSNGSIEKWDWALDSELAADATAARSLDTAGAHRIFATSARDTVAQPSPPGALPVPPPAVAVPGPGRSIDTATFCVVDLETTGFSPRLGDRVIEIAAIRLRADGTRLGEWASLLDPQRDVGATHVHGISGGDVIGAPRFDEIAGDLLAAMDGAVLVAHNKRFDLEFLTAEFSRLGHELEPWPSLCTLGLGAQLEPDGHSRRLDVCCARFGIELPEAHTAGGDASATADLLVAYLKLAARFGVTSLDQLDCTPSDFPEMLQLPRSGRGHPRGGGRRRVESQATYLAGLVTQLGAVGPADPDVSAYLDLLDRALEDRRLTQDEATALRETANAWGLDRAVVERAHARYFEALLQAAQADGVITPLERSDLDVVAQLLSIEPGSPAASQTESDLPRPDDLTGRSVCFTGALVGTMNGEPITRTMAEALAQQAGLIVKSGVSKGLDLLVVADPDSQSGKARRARDLGSRIMSEAVFWRSIGAPVD